MRDTFNFADFASMAPKPLAKCGTEIPTIPCPPPYEEIPDEPIPYAINERKLNEDARARLREANAHLLRAALRNQPPESLRAMACKVLLRDSDLTLRDLEVLALDYRLERFGGNVAKVSRSMDTCRNTIYRRLARFM